MLIDNIKPILVAEDIGYTPFEEYPQKSQIHSLSFLLSPISRISYRSEKDKTTQVFLTEIK